MLFNSIHFIVFFPIVAALYFLIKPKYRWILLLLSSYYFYMSWRAEYAILLVITTVVSYFAALKIHESKKQSLKKRFLWLALLANVGLLFIFKYFNFLSAEVTGFLARFSLQFEPFALKVLLPVGISFYTFQTVGYLFDVYRGKVKPERHLGIFAVYVSFFPQLVAGPIERAHRLIPQFFERHDFDANRVSAGLRLMLWGFFKKVAIADRLAVMVNLVYNNPTGHHGLTLILATFLFGFQIYCDFSGYSDIAIGAAQVMGFRLMQNFRRPYMAKSISDFWKRWHISLASWFRDYVYIPLGGNRVSFPRWAFNILVVFFVLGVWHGANWTFFLWGLLFGVYLIVAKATKGFREKAAALTGLARLPKLHTFLQVATTFVIVNLTWIFFRANSLSDAKYILTHLLDFTGVGAELLAVMPYIKISLLNGRFSILVLFLASKLLAGPLGVTLMSLVLSFALIAFVVYIHAIQPPEKMRQFLSDKPTWFRWTICIVLLLAILFLGENSFQFIYFQF